MNKIQYSKILPVLTSIIFCLCLIAGFLTDYSSAVDVSFYVTAVTISGSIMLTTITAYLKKAAMENSIKCRMSMYEEMTKTKLEYNKQMIIFQKKYGVDIEEDSEMTDMLSETLSSMDEKLNSDLEENDTVEEEKCDE